MLAVPCAIAAFVLLLRDRRAKPARPIAWAIIDGSNVMHWDGGAPDLRPVRDVIRALSDRGITPGVVFDANAGYKLEGRYLNDRELSRLLRLPRDRVMIVPRGTPVDPVILSAARDYSARVVSQDRFRDWVADFPEIRQPGFLIRGRYEDATLRLELPG